MLMESNQDDRIARLERDNRSIKLLLVFSLVVFFTIGAVSLPQTSATTLEVNRLIFRSADGAFVGELRVEGKDEHDDLTLRDANGFVRLSVSGLDGINIPAYSLISLHDPQGRKRVTLIADADGAGVGIGVADLPKVFSYGSPASTTRVSLRVDGETGSLTFFDKDSKPVYAVPLK